MRVVHFNETKNNLKSVLDQVLVDSDYTLINRHDSEETMHNFKFISKIDREGIINLQLPTAFANREVEIVLVINPKPQQINIDRPIGQYAGKMRMDDDFTAPLPDEFWLGEDI